MYKEIIPKEYPKDLDSCLKILEEVRYECSGYECVSLSYMKTWGSWSVVFRNPRNFSSTNFLSPTPLEACYKEFDFLRSLTK